MDEAKILIVDDYPGNIDILCQAMPKNYQCRTALSGEEALMLLQRTGFVPDLILLDVMMPEMDGFEVCQRLKQDNRYRDIPVIFVSAVAEVQSKIQALSLGGVDYITKPFNFKEIRARIDIHLKLHSLSQKMHQANQQLEVLVDEKIRDISETQMEIIFALSNLVNQRDRAANGHIERIQQICSLIAGQLRQYPTYLDRIDDHFIDQIFKASALHDIGKVSVPDRILMNRDGLSENDRETLKNHTLVGAQTLEEVQAKYPGNGFIDMGIDIARFHHERWDGSGYPDGLRGDEIPLAAQIMSLADKIDDLYAQSAQIGYMTLEEIDQTIQAESGIGFAPLLVEAYMACTPAIESIFDELRATGIEDVED